MRMLGSEWVGSICIVRVDFIEKVGYEQVMRGSEEVSHEEV